MVRKERMDRKKRMGSNERIRSKKRIVSFRFAAVIFWMAVIFRFSSMPAAQSSESSNFLTDCLVKLLHPWYERLSAPEQAKWYDSLSFAIRKCAHMLEYGILAALTAGWLGSWWETAKRKLYILTLAVCLCYAASDEFHQLFVPGRSGRVSDVFIDFCGMVIGLLTMHLFFVCKKTEKEEKEF